MSYKSEFVLLQTSSLIIYLVQFVKYWQIFLELNSKRQYLSSEKESSIVSRVHVLRET